MLKAQIGSTKISHIEKKSVMYKLSHQAFFFFPLSLLKQDHEILDLKAFNSTELTLPENVYYPNQNGPSILKTFTF